MLNANARILCSHGGQVAVIPKQTQVLVGGAPALCVGDLEGSLVLNCPIPPTPLTKPCTVLVSVPPIPGVAASLVAKAMGRPLLLAGATGITDGVPPGPAMVAFPGQTQVLA